MESKTALASTKESRNGTSMAAAVIAAPGETRVEDIATPSPGPTQVRIRVEGCGVCGSNLPTWEGREWFDYPLEAGAPGHETWGVVDAAGEDVDGIAPGTRVAALSYNGFAEYDVAEADSVVPLPDWLNGQPFPGEPLGCAMNVFRRSDIQPGQTVAIIGIGFLGALLAQLSASAGARVIAVSRRPYSLEVARSCGADEVIEMDDHGRIIGAVNDITGGDLCERVIEVVGLQWPLDIAGELTGERGRLVIAGYHQDGKRSVNMQQWNWRGIDVVNAHERDQAMYVQGMRDAIEAIDEGRLDPFPLFTHSMPLDELDEGLRHLENRPDGFVKALIRMDS